MSTLSNPAFWFNLRPGSMGSLSRNIFIILLVILILAAVYFFISKKKKGSYKNLFSRLYNFCAANAVIGLLLLFFNYEIVPFFSAHFWFILWAVSAIWWLINISKELKKVAQRKEQQDKVDEIKKYLP